MTPKRKTRTTLLAMILVLSAVSTVALGADGAVNINTADARELALLPRVGAIVAQRILDFREENGEFRSIDDLMLVEGIGEKTFELMKPFVSLQGKTTLIEKVKASRHKNPETDE
jgi:competence protein ComEA